MSLRATTGSALPATRPRALPIRSVRSLPAAMRQRTVAAHAAEVLTATSDEPAQPVHAAAPQSPAEAAPQAAATSAPATPAAAGGDGDVQGAMLQPSAANKQWVRAAAVLAATAAVASTSAVLPGQGWRFVALLAYGAWMGSTLWNTFFVGLTMFKNMPRQTFGRVQSKLFPRFFALTTGANLVLLAGAVVGGAATGTVTMLGTAAALNLANWFVIEPTCTGLMFERYAIENKANKTEEDQAQIKALYKKFGAWHGVSSLNNLITFAVSVAYAWTLAGALTI